MSLRDALLRGVRASSLVVAAGALVALALILAQIAQRAPLGLHRFREPTWVLYAALGLWALARPSPGAFLARVAERAARVLASPRFFAWLCATSLALFLVVTAATHLSFRTFADLAVFDEALEWTLRGCLLYSPILARSFLSEHFSPILLLLAPLHAVWRSPWLLVWLHPLVLWAAVFPLRALLEDEGASREVTNLACMVYLSHPIVASALHVAFHVEAFLPVTAFALARTARRGPWWAYGALLLLALAIKEDVGIYLLGLALWQVVAERRVARGAITGIVALAWVGLVVLVVMPGLPGGTEGYRFSFRWSAWGHTPGEILIGMASRPDRVARALLAPAFLVFFARLVATPFLTRWGWLLVLLPWTLAATSSTRELRTLGLHYGLPLLAFATLAAVAGVGGASFRRVSRARLAPALAALAVVLAFSHLIVPEIPPERREVLAAIGRIPRDASVQAMSCFLPVLDYDQRRPYLQPGDSLRADFVILRTAETTWPFSETQARALADEALRSRRYEPKYARGGFLILEARR